jgi:multisubunit Na+/H+ antiporter MnhB subunit
MFNTPVKINIRVLPILLLVWGGVTWFGISQHPGRGLWQGLLIGLVTTIFLLIADFGPVKPVFTSLS